MPGPLRRSPLVALLLLLLTPGLGGWAVQALHPCPAALPWVAEAGGAEAGGVEHEHGKPGLPGHSGHEGECHCIGSCHAAPAVQAEAAPTVTTPVVAYQQVPTVPTGARRFAGAAPRALHPPATAPPVAS